MSTRRMVGGTVLAVALAATVACGRQNENANQASITLTGCLQPGDSPNTFRLVSTGGPSGAVGTGGDPQAERRDNPTGTEPKQGTSDIGQPTSRVYTLVPDTKRSPDLNMHANTLVEINGRIDQAAMGTSGSSQQNQPSQRGEPAMGSGSSVGGNAPTVHVETIKRVSARCGETR